MTHPIRDLQVRTFSNPVFGWIAQFGDGRSFPIVFRGPTRTAVLAKAETFRADVLQKHEAKFLARKRAAAKAKATREAKKLEDQGA